jgi:hypothetical protein
METVQRHFFGLFVFSQYQKYPEVLIVASDADDVAFCLGQNWFLLPYLVSLTIVNGHERAVLEVEADLFFLILVEEHANYIIGCFVVESALVFKRTRLVSVEGKVPLPNAREGVQK